DGFSVAEKIRTLPELGDPAILMLTSAGHSGDVSRCRELGINAYLMKPVKQSELLEAILKVSGGEGRLTRDAPPDPGLRRPAPSGSLRVLLAEDHPVNQRLAARLLDKEGHSVVVVGNG